MQSISVQGEMSAAVVPEQRLYVFMRDPPVHFRKATGIWNGTLTPP